MHFLSEMAVEHVVHWISRCLEQCPTIALGRLDELALELSLVGTLRAVEPKRAAVEWLRQGIPLPC
jgi:hypothetical protein